MGKVESGKVARGLWWRRGATGGGICGLDGGVPGKGS